MPAFRRVLILLFATAIRSAAAVSGPYAADANTVHLFHLDEASGSSAANSGTSTGSLLAFNGTAGPSNNTNAQPSQSGLLGATGSTGFGKCATFQSAAHGLGLDANNSGGFQPGNSTTTHPPDGITHSSLAAVNGAFTLEALVNIPALTGANREIICTDSSLNSRGFQFRINTTGQLEFNFISTNVSSTTFAIPTTGNNGFAANEWFHVALSFDGTTSRFYWTRINSSNSAANLIGTSTAETTSASVNGPLVIGNEGRGASSEGLLGLIDEVRISNIARSATGFIFTSSDTDNDGLEDAWEIANFGNITIQDGSGDPDLDTFNNGAEVTAGSSPNNAASTPLDIDADSLPDSWEISFFGNLYQTSSADPDGDGETNAIELANGSTPNHRASSSTDLDADGLPDAWELNNFSSLATNAGSDPDGDRFSNLQELSASTFPAQASSRPSGTAVKLVPLDDGNPATSDFGYGGTSAINSVSFVRSSLKTVGNQQFITWYGRHQHEASAAYNNTIWIGRRTLGTSNWEIYRHPSFTANAITDGHDVIAFGIDGEGYIHLSWGMHGDAFHYAKSLGPITGTGPMTLGADTTMTGRENNVTYPQFLALPDGDLLYLFREGSSGNGDVYLNRYDTATRTWDNVHRTGSTQLPFIKGTGWTPNYNAYVNMPQLGRTNGNELTLTWCWRYSSGTSETGSGAVGYQTNSNLYFARSLDAGLTWQRYDGTPYSLPISSIAESGIEATRAERIVNIPENSSLINQAGMCLDQSGNPVIANWWAPLTASGNFRRQYMIVFRDGGGAWQTRTVSSRTIDPTTTRYPEASVRNMGRPIVVTDDSDRIIVAYRDNQDNNGMTIVHSLPKAEDPDRLVWIEFDLTTENLGNYEPTIDHELWERERQLHFLYQPADGQGYTSPANTASRISVLEWDGAAYFRNRSQPSITFSPDRTQAHIACPSEPSWSYRLWTSPDLLNWSQVETRAGTGEPLNFQHALAPGESKRFWRIESSEGGF